MDGDIKAVKQHLANGVDVNVMADNGGTPLGWNALLGQYEVAELLIQKGASVNFKGGDGGTALHSAAFLGRLEVAKLLIENGANIGAKNNNFETPIDVTMANWENTQFILGMFNISVDRKETEAGRAKVAELLNQSDNRNQKQTGDPFHEDQPPCYASTTKIWICEGLIPKVLASYSNLQLYSDTFCFGQCRRYVDAINRLKACPFG